MSYSPDSIFATFLGTSDDPDGHSVDVEFEIEIVSNEAEFPTTAAIAYLAQDSSSPPVSLPVSGPANVLVENPINPHKWVSDEQTAIVDCAKAATNPCVLSITAFDMFGDAPITESTSFNSPLIPPAPAPAPAPVSGSPDVEIIIRVKGACPEIRTVRAGGGRPHPPPRSKRSAKRDAANRSRKKRADRAKNDVWMRRVKEAGNWRVAASPVVFCPTARRFGLLSFEPRLHRRSRNSEPPAAALGRGSTELAEIQCRCRLVYE